jgi:hypothetical protein
VTFCAFLWLNPNLPLTRSQEIGISAFRFVPAPAQKAPIAVTPAGQISTRFTISVLSHSVSFSVSQFSSFPERPVQASAFQFLCISAFQFLSFSVFQFSVFSFQFSAFSFPKVI